MNSNKRSGIKELLGYGFLFTSLLIFLYPNLSSAQTSGISIAPAVVEETLRPGSEQSYSFTIKNLSNDEQTYRLQVKNIADINQSGLPIFTPASEVDNGHHLANWINLEINELTLSANESRRVDFVIKVPEKIKPGGYYGGIEVGSLPSKAASGGAIVTYQTTNIIAIEVEGNILYKADITNFSLNKYLHTENKVNGFIEIKNDSETHIRPVGKIKFYNWWGEEVHETVLNSSGSAIFPNSSKKFIFDWDREERSFGKYLAVASFAYGNENDQQTLVDSKSFWIINPLVAIFSLIGSFVVLCMAYVVSNRIFINTRVEANYSKARRTIKFKNYVTVILSKILFSVLALAIFITLILRVYA